MARLAAAAGGDSAVTGPPAHDAGEGTAMRKEPGFQLEGRAADRYEQFVAPIMAPFVRAAVEEL